MSKLSLKFSKVNLDKTEFKKSIKASIKRAWVKAITAAITEAVWRVGMDTGMSRASWLATARKVRAGKIVEAATKGHGKPKDGKSYTKGINIGKPPEIELGEKGNNYYFKFFIKPVQYRVNENTLKEWKSLEAARRAFITVMADERKRFDISIKKFLTFRR